MNHRTRSFEEIIAEGKLLEKAVQQAVQEAVLAAARAGHSVPTWKDGRVVWLTPEETLAQLAEDAKRLATEDDRPVQAAQ